MMKDYCYGPILKRLVTLASTIFVTCTISFGQHNEKYEPFKSSNYPASKYLVKLDSATFSKFKIEIRQVKTLDNSKWDSTSFYCRAWLTVRQGRKVLSQLFFKEMESVGGCSGLFIPETQPRKDYFIFSKFGDYDGSIFIIDTTGEVTEKVGGMFYISKDKKYLFSNYDSDESGLTVYNLNSHLIVYSSQEEEQNYLGDWYFRDGKYFARAYDDDEDEEEQTIKIATYDFSLNKLVITTVDKNYLQEASKLEVYNSYQSAKDCNCGR